MRVLLKDVWEKYRIKFIRGSQILWKDHWALRGVDFNLNDHEVVGVIGKNGAGKSTLLKVIAGMFTPDKGIRTVEGTIASLFDLGAGLLPELTGRENILHNLTSYGIAKSTADEKIQEIIAFSQIGDFLDAPMKYYSSGMYARVAFSLALSVHPDIFLVDDILSVGDTFFQAKSLTKIIELKRQGCAIVIVTHDMDIVRKLCDRVVVLEQGSIVFEDKTDRAIAFYMKDQALSEQPGPLEAGGSYTVDLPISRDSTAEIFFDLKTPGSERMFHGTLIKEQGILTLYFPEAFMRFTVDETKRDSSVMFSFISEQQLPQTQRFFITVSVDMQKIPVRMVYAGNDRIPICPDEDSPIRLHEHILDHVSMQIPGGYLIIQAADGFFSIMQKEKKLYLTVGIMKNSVEPKALLGGVSIRFQKEYIPSFECLPDAPKDTHFPVLLKNRAVDLYFQARKITSGQGLYISLKREGIWFDSRQAVVSTLESTKNQLCLERIWYFYNLVQKEEYTMQGNTLSMSISVIPEIPIDKCSLCHCAIMLDRVYKLFEYGSVCKGTLTDTFSSGYAQSPYVFYNLPAQFPLILKGESVPTLTIEDAARTHTMVLENSDDFYKSRIIKIEHVCPESVLRQVSFTVRMHIE